MHTLVTADIYLKAKVQFTLPYNERLEGLGIHLYNLFNLGAIWGWAVNDTPLLL